MQSVDTWAYFAKAMTLLRIKNRLKAIVALSNYTNGKNNTNVRTNQAITFLPHSNEVKKSDINIRPDRVQAILPGTRVGKNEGTLQKEESLASIEGLVESQEKGKMEEFHTKSMMRPVCLQPCVLKRQQYQAETQLGRNIG